MKKALLFSAVAVLVLLSCAACIKKSCTRTETNVTCKTGKQGPDRAVPFEYKGHKYIIFHSYGGVAATSYSCAVVHDPDCPCHQEEDE